jgi:hypothetical protein
MSFTRLELRLRKEAGEIARLAHVNFGDAEEWEGGLERQTRLRICIHNMVIAAVVSQYTLFDEILADVICRYYFKWPGKRRFILWRQKKFKTFVHFILDEMYLLKKMELAHAISPLPKEVRETIRKLNAIRNSLAHSYFPENRKEHKKARKVLYAGKDIRRSEGLEQFLTDCHEAWVYLAKRAYGQWEE